MFWIILIIVLAAVIIPAAQVSKENQNLKEQYKLLSTQYQALQKQCASLEKYKKYAKYSKIADAEATAAFILQQAHSEATLIISDAQTEARKIAGEAIDARDNAILYKKTATAMKNIISGYGTDYIIPSQTLFDNIADSYGYSQASKDYKAVRARIRDMVKHNQAATCDYAEASRKQTAINFITDAFNGKADSILAGAKADNFGTLKQKLTDTFTIVNHNGKAFRNARINEAYFQLRLEELRLACLLAEIRKRDIEEQRRIKEQMREEEKARREIEKALADAAKEEALLQKAMANVRAQLEQANAAQKAVYEAQIAELERKYQEAEDRNKRALSMAQQTKSGHVYIISNEGSFGQDVFKIGMTRRLDPLDRVRELSSASVPFAFDVHAMIWSEDAPALETMLHKKFAPFQVNKANFRKEFFRLPLSTIRSELESYGLHVKWTLASESSEYLDTIAIEKAIHDNPQALDDWLNHQLALENTRNFTNPSDDDEDDSKPDDNSDA